MRRVTRTREGVRVLLTAVFERDEDGKVIGVCQELPVDSFADTIEEADKRLRKAITVYFDSACKLENLDDILATLENIPAPVFEMKTLKPDNYYLPLEQPVLSCAG